MANSRPPSPGLQATSGGGIGYFTVPFERFARDETSEWAGAFTLLGMQLSSIIPSFLLSDMIIDTLETYFDSHIDLLQRNLQKHGDRLKFKADQAFKIDSFKIRTPSGELLSREVLSENFDREVKNFRLKVSTVTSGQREVILNGWTVWW